MNNNRSRVAYFLVLIALSGSFYYYYNAQKRILDGGDTWGYYAYLPALVVHGDITTFRKSFVARELQAGRPAPEADQKPFFTELSLPNDHIIDKYTCGVAIMASPFYMTAHALAAPLGYARNGFSPPYTFAYLLAGLLYVLWGLWAIRSALLYYFPDWSVAITLVLLALATNLYYFSAYESGMSHSFLFFLYAQLILSTIRFYRSPDWKNGLLIGLCAGGITAIRPNEVICLLIPLLYGVARFADLANNWTLWRRHWPKIAGAVACFILAGIPQFIYWKGVTGHFFFYSYEKEGFNFANPKIIEGLFSYQNGWLAYSPIMALALAGVFVLPKEVKWKAVIAIFLPVHIYVIYSWWCWNYINGVGSRPMVETYPLLAIGMASFWTWLSDKKWLRAFFAGIGVFCIYLSVSLIWQLSEGLVWTDCANRRFYWYMVGKTSADWRGVTMFDTREWQPDTNRLKTIATLTTHTFEDSLNQHFVRKNPDSKFCFRLDKQQETYPIFEGTIAEAGIQKGQWIKAELRFMREYMGHDFAKNSLLVIAYVDKNGKSIKNRSIRLDNKSSRNGATLWGWEAHIWTKAYFFVRFSRGTARAERIKVSVRNTTDNPIFFDDCQVSLCETVD